jgi:hypothetical protein
VLWPNAAAAPRRSRAPRAGEGDDTSLLLPTTKGSGPSGTPSTSRSDRIFLIGVLHLNAPVTAMNLHLSA